MALNYFYKCNPLVAKAAGATSFDHFTWADGTVLLWAPDLKKIDRAKFLLTPDEFLADIGAVKLTDPEAKVEQDYPSIRLPKARLPQYQWEQPDLSVKEGTEDNMESSVETGESEDVSEAMEGSEDE